MKSMIYSGIARALGFIPQGIATLIASRLIIDHFGLHAFDTYALIVSVMTLIPLNNLGVGASVTQELAAHGPGAEIAERAGLTASRVLTVSGLALAVISTVLGLLDLWPRLLGDASGSNAFTAAALVIYGIGFVPGLGASVLLGVGRNPISIVVQSFQAPLGLLVVGMLVVFNIDGRTVIVVPALALLLVNVITMVLSQTRGGYPWHRIVPRIPFRGRYPGARIRALSGPMLVTTLAVPIAFAGDRIVLSHVSTASAVANYSVVLQIFAPVTGLIVATAQPLWPMYTRARMEGGQGPNMRLVLIAFLSGTLVVCAGLVLIADRIGTLIGGDAINLGFFLPTLVALVMLLQAVAFPLSMGLVDPVGARFVAICAVITVPANIGLSIWLARDLGAPGPLISLLVVSIVVQIIPTSLFLRKRSRSSEPVLL